MLSGYGSPYDIPTKKYFTKRYEKQRYQDKASWDSLDRQCNLTNIAFLTKLKIIKCRHIFKQLLRCSVILLAMHNDTSGTTGNFRLLYHNNKAKYTYLLSEFREDINICKGKRAGGTKGNVKIESNVTIICLGFHLPYDADLDNLVSIMITYKRLFLLHTFHNTKRFVS